MKIIKLEKVPINKNVIPDKNSQSQNKRGEWVTAIPLPWLFFRKKCECGEKFWTLQRYREHYAYHHILYPFR